jgi:hypothetical protein
LATAAKGDRQRGHKADAGLTKHVLPLDLFPIH